MSKKAIVKKKSPDKKKAIKKQATKKPVPFKNYVTGLRAGLAAPWFEGTTQHGQLINLNSFPGKTLVLYFYPQDDTETCTKQACNLRDDYNLLTGKHYMVVGVSPDEEKSHSKFAAKYNLPFPLIADTEMKIINAYDVWGKKKFMGKIYDGLVRTTFLIHNGIIKQVITRVKSGEHAKQILESNIFE